MAWASDGPLREQVLSARTAFFKDTGEVREDEPLFDVFQDAFVDWYLCDLAGQDGLTVAQRFVRDQQGLLPQEELDAMDEFTRTRPSLWVLTKLQNGAVKVRDLLAKETMVVTERRRLAGVQPGDIFNARIIHMGSAWWFTGAPMFHPGQVRHMLKRVASHQRRKQQPKRTELLHTLAARRIRVDRYRRVDPEQHYKDLVPPRRFLFW